jgi:hypothetical protein
MVQAPVVRVAPEVEDQAAEEVDPAGRSTRLPPVRRT